MTAGGADRLATERADTTVVAALTPICVEKFTQNGDAKATLIALQKISSNWEQGQYVEKGGWATRPGAVSSDYQLARASHGMMAYCTKGMKLVSHNLNRTTAAVKRRRAT